MTSSAETERADAERADAERADAERTGAERADAERTGAERTDAEPGEAARREADALPPALASMWRLLKLGYHYEPRLMGVAFALAMLTALPEALVALWLKLLAEGLLDHDRALVYWAMAGLVVSGSGTWFLSTISTRLQRRFRDRVSIALESHVARLQATVSTVTLHERPDFLDRLSVLRNQVFVLDHMYMSVFSTMGFLLRLAVTIVLLSTISPVLLLLVLVALPTVLTASWRPAVERDAQERVASANRLARHLFTTATTAPPGKEVRVTGIGARLATQRRAAWERGYRPVASARAVSAWWHAGAWAIFGAGYVGAIVFVAAGLHAPAPDVLLVLAAGAQLCAYIGATVGEIGFLRGIWMDGSRRLAWLEDYAASLVEHAVAPVPSSLVRGIEFERVGFAYPGTTTEVLRDVTLTLPAGAVVAIVGENGAGKSTLVKLLSKFYEPTAGRILVDGVDLASMPAADWRARLAGAYQDFFRFEVPAQHTVGLGDLPRLDDVAAVRAAVDRAGADEVVAGLADGLETQLGPAWPEGVDVSFGQWQKFALARGFMRDEPLVLVLDEPTAALDAETEHALFEQYALQARGAGGGPESQSNGRIVILVSHRFSTVRMADLIVVLDGAHVVEVGSHEDLLARGGQYAELYAIQAAAYR